MAELLVEILVGEVAQLPHDCPLWTHHYLPGHVRRYKIYLLFIERSN